ncbi:MAG TPA: hypothetical protein PKE06_16875 [Flavilitoribacter sp.]|nr:hypothetical protein [Flavilitoribacter sp.]HMQ87291.1 hypothetical protein [Flavilitoribacter sp.]
MKIEYRPTSKTLSISDDVRFRYRAQQFILYITILNSILNTYLIFRDGPGFFNLLWIGVGLLAAAALYELSGKSWQGEIAVQDIEAWKETSSFGRKILRLKLKNGTQRDLLGFANREHLEAIKTLFYRIGIHPA